MVCVQTSTIGFLESIVIFFGLQSMEGEFYISYTIAISTVDTLDGGIGRIS